MRDLLQQFNEMNKIPLFEIENNGEFYIYDIVADDIGLSAGSTDCSIEWDDTFSLDEHLQSLYELCYEDILAQIS